MEYDNMNSSKIINYILQIAAILAFISGCASYKKLDFDIHNPITQQETHWVKLKDLPNFTPKDHSDGCSGGMSESYAKLTVFHTKYGKTLPWRGCCVIHDEAYYYGGTREEKWDADEVLKECVNDNQGGIILGTIMQGAVTPGGLPYFPTSFRWGYGEDHRNGKKLAQKTE